MLRKRGSYMEKNEIRIFTNTIHKNELKKKKNTIKLLEENIHRTHLHINHSKYFLDPSSRVIKINE